MRDEWAEKAKDLLVQLLTAWNNVDYSIPPALFVEDAIFSSPYITENGGVIRGLNEFNQIVRQHYGDFPKREIVDIHLEPAL